MPPKKRVERATRGLTLNRKRPKTESTEPVAASSLCDQKTRVPAHVQNHIKLIVERIVQNDLDAQETSKLFEDELGLRHVNVSDIDICLKKDDDSGEDDVHEGKGVGSTSSKMKGAHNHKSLCSSSLEFLAIRLCEQTMKAETVFSMLDKAKKGVVVVEDLQRVINELLGTTTDENLTFADLEEMIQMFDQRNDGLLTKDDIVRIARTINLR